MMPKLSIITVCRNAREALKATAKSVFEQSCGDFEWIVIDGDSSDGTVEDLRGMEDARVRFLSEGDTGIYDAMNKGLKLSRGEWVWFLNAGDILYDASAVEQLKGAPSGKDIYFGEVTVIGEDGEVLGTRSEVSPHRLPDELKKAEFSMGMLVSHQAFIVRRMIAPRFDSERYCLSADLDWMLRILSQSRSSVRLGRLACVLRDGATLQNWRISQWERFLILSRHFGVWRNLINHFKIVVRRLLHGFHYRLWK